MIKVLFISLLFLYYPGSAQKGNVDMQEIIHAARQLSEQDYKDSARVTLNNAIDQLLVTGDSVDVLKTLLEQGKEYELTGHYSLALIFYLRGINIANRKQLAWEKGIAHLGLSNVNFRIANNDQALASSIESVNIFHQAGDTSNYINASMLMAQVYISMEKFDEAYKIYQKMLEHATATGDSALIADGLDHLGVIHTFKGEHDQALSFHQRAVKINNIIGNQVNLSINLANIGEVYLRKGLYEAALDNLLESQRIADKIQFRSLQIFIHYILGETYSILDKDMEAIESFEKSLELITALGETREKPHVYHLLSQHYERNNDLKNALAYFKIFSNLTDSLNMLNANYKTEELKVLYEIDQREQALRSVLLEKQLQQNELNVSKDTIKLQYIILALVVMGLGFTTFFTIYFYKSQRKLRQANNTKDILFSIIGHDLRGPVGNIKSLLEIAQKANPTEQKRMIDIMEQPVNAVFDLLNELLEWSGTIHKNTEYYPEKVPLYEVAGKAIEVFEAQAQGKNIEVKNLITKDAYVHADTNHLYTILRNLVSNAIKFTPSQGNVSLEAVQKDGLITIKVTDTGVGMDPSVVKKILTKNYVASTYGTNKEKGSGLGILLCHEFLKINGSRLNIDSKPGEGSTFSFDLERT